MTTIPVEKFAVDDLDKLIEQLRVLGGDDGHLCPFSVWENLQTQVQLGYKFNHSVGWHVTTDSTGYGLTIRNSQGEGVTASYPSADVRRVIYNALVSKIDDRGATKLPLLDSVVERLTGQPASEVWQNYWRTHK